MVLLTVRQAAARLGVGYSTLKQWIYQGRVRTRVTGGGHHRIPEGEVDRLLAPSAATVAASPAPGRSGARDRRAAGARSSAKAAFDTPIDDRLLSNSSWHPCITRITSGSTAASRLRGA